MLSVTVPPGPAVTPRTVAMASGTAAGSLIVASSTTQTPSVNSWVSSAATCTESRVLPTPPAPVRVTSRCACTSSPTSFTSTSRPTKLVTCTGRFPGVASNVRSAGNVVSRPSARTW